MHCPSCNQTIIRLGAAEAKGGPFDGRVLSASHRRHWVTAVDDVGSHQLWSGDFDYCAFARQYLMPSAGTDRQREVATEFLRTVTGCYVIESEDSSSASYVPLWGVALTPTVDRYRDLALFLTHHAVQAMAREYSFERHNMALAAVVAVAWPDDIEIVRACARYMAIGIIKITDSESP